MSKKIFIIFIVFCLGSQFHFLVAHNLEDQSDTPLFIYPQISDFDDNQKLLKRILSNPHGYFRFINIPFSEEICLRFKDAIAESPTFNLHGDPHIEQYAVTDLGRGLTDFDDSSAGPAILDLLRFGVSMNLACRINGWEIEAINIYHEFLSGYRMALKEPNVTASEPGIAKLMRLNFKNDKPNYYNWVNNIMEPIPEDELDSLLSAMDPYFQAMFRENKNLPSEYFHMESIGYLKMGIGSALDDKYLIRCRGESDDPLDDIVLEIKEVRDISGISCLTRAQKFDPFRILIGQARIAYQPFFHLGYFDFRGKYFWVHAWVQNYHEIDVNSSFKNIQDLKEIALDVGVQLGRGHPKQIAAPLDLQLRLAQMKWLNIYEQKMSLASQEIADEVEVAWALFTAAYEKEKGDIVSQNKNNLKAQ